MTGADAPTRLGPCVKAPMMIIGRRLATIPTYGRSIEKLPVGVPACRPPPLPRNSWGLLVAATMVLRAGRSVSLLLSRSQKLLESASRAMQSSELSASRSCRHWACQGKTMKAKMFELNLVSLVFNSGISLALAFPCAAGETVEYVHTNALGSIVAITNEAGEVMSRSSFEPYGSSPDATDGPAYAGHVKDSLTGLSYMQQRYYDPDIGRFLSADPVGPSASGSALFNRYYYAGNNPYRYYDPDGRCTGSRITNVDNTCASTGEFTTQAKSATSVGVRSAASVFNHSSVSSPDASVAPSASTMPQKTTAAARRFLKSSVGGAVGREAVRTQQKINLIQTLPESGFMPSFSGGFDALQGGNYVSYSLDVAGYKQGLGNPAELRGVGLDTLLTHEVGHTPLGAAALGYGHLPFDSSDSGEINAVKYLENPYRREIGLPARETYSGIPIP